MIRSHDRGDPSSGDPSSGDPSSGDRGVARYEHEPLPVLAVAGTGTDTLRRALATPARGGASSDT